MKTKTLILIVVFTLAISGLFAWGNAARNSVAAVGASGPRAQTSVLAAPELFYDFGIISMKNGNVTKEFSVTNPTDQDIVVETVFTSCMCTKAFIVGAGGTKGPFGMPGMSYVPPANETIGSGESRIIRVVYDPNAHGPAGVGFIDRFVTLTDADGGTLEFEIQANVTP